MLVITNYGNQNLIVSFPKRDKLQDLFINQLKLEMYVTYKKDQKITTHFEAVDDEDVINKGYLDEKIIKIKDHLSK